MKINTNLKQIISTYRYYAAFIVKEDRSNFREEYFKIVRSSLPDRRPETVAEEALFNIEFAKNPKEYRFNPEILNLRLDYAI